ncbi:MAG: FAD-dependent oxidoreductase [Planctomycetota bacterium]
MPPPDKPQSNSPDAIHRRAGSRRTIVLYGLGHTNTEMLRRFALNPIQDTRLIAVSKFPTATYSGMLPAVLAGQFPASSMEIDLARLAKHAEAVLLIDDLESSDFDSRTITLQTAGEIRFDVLSIGVGSVPTGASVFDDSKLVAIKPMQTFLQRLDDRIAEVAKQNKAETSFVIVGGGVAGVEIAFCLERRLRTQWPTLPFRIQLVSGSARVADGMTERSSRIINELLFDRGINVITSQRAVSLDQDTLRTDAGLEVKCDVCLWATGATAPDVLKRFEVKKDKQGFLATRGTLELAEHRGIFAVGDCGTSIENRHPKAGVYAVRQCPVLWHNMRSSLAGTDLKEFHPQRDFLRLINTGDGRALAQYGSLTIHHRGCRWLKDFIDGRFLKRHRL